MAMPSYLERPPPRHRARAVKLRRRRVAAATAGALAIAVIVAVVVATGGSSGARRRASAGEHRAAAAASRASRHERAHARAHAAARPQHHGPAPGTLPQTHALPPSTSAGFKAKMADLWAGVVRDSVRQAMPAFFPKAAYLQVKAIPDAGADYENRLVHGFALDIGAAHALLGAGASSARLVGVNVPEGYAHWVVPGACYNRIGYYEVPNARMVYTEGGQTRSFGIASMISWRGVWYVVHFGAVLESGVVDSPSTGAGTSIDTGTC
jgi:hypothetical protein